MIQYMKYKAKDLFPAYFAIIMTTGALSIGTHLLGMEIFAQILLVFNTIAYITLWILTFIRLFCYFPKLADDLRSHHLGPGFFTIIAGTCMFGSQIFILTNHYLIPFLLWVIGIGLWVVIMYTFFTSITVRKDKPSLDKGINGAWLIAAVATQSISILGTLVSSYLGNSDIILFFTLSMFLLGCMLYLNIMTLIFYRLTFLRLDFPALTPPYWINMGAVAIATLAGSTLILHAENMPLLVEILPFLKGFTIFFWIAGTWWIPLLFILMIWRHIVHRYPLTYDPQFWAMAFPLAMYTTGTYQLSEALELSFLLIITYIAVVFAIGAFMIGVFSLFYHLYQDIRDFRYKDG